MPALSSAKAVPRLLYHRLPAKLQSKIDRALGVGSARRSALLLKGVNVNQRIVEIGPSYNPVAPKADGWQSFSIDHATRAELVEKYRGHPGVDVTRIEEVDFVWTEGLLVDAVPAELQGSFDVFIASHVIEHSTDLVGFFDAAQRLVRGGGRMILAVPDKRYCFDFFRPLSTTGAAIAAHAEGRSRHPVGVVFDHVAYAVMNDGAGAWDQQPIGSLGLFSPLAAAWDASVLAHPGAENTYVDVHAWQFTPASFELLALELAWLGEIDWEVERIAPQPGCEFFAWLRRGGAAAAKQLSEADLQARRLELLRRIVLDLREQGDHLIGAAAAPVPTSG